MRQYTGSEVETIVKDEVMLSLEALIRVGARRRRQARRTSQESCYRNSDCGGTSGLTDLSSSLPTS